MIAAWFAILVTGRYPRELVDSVEAVTMHQPLTVPHPIPDQLVELIAQRFRVLGEPVRIKLLDRLRENSATVSELQAATGSSQQNDSKLKTVLQGTRGRMTPSSTSASQ